MDAWLKQSSNANATMKKPTNSLNYSKFDKIVDSDDEEEEKQRRRQARRAVQPRSPGDVPPHLRAAYARVTIAQERGDTKELRAAMLELEQQLQAMPDEFKEQLALHGRDPATPEGGRSRRGDECGARLPR